MQHILLVTFPFFALVLGGYVAARRGLLPLEAIPGLNTFVLFFALPCMLYRFAATTPIVRLLDPAVSVTWLACALAMVGFVIATARRAGRGWNDASFGALVAAFPNSGFMGVPLLVALLGQRAAAPAIVALALDMVVTSSLCIALSRLDGANQRGATEAVGLALRGMLTNPLPWSILLGCLTTATGFVLWLPALRTVEMLADGASPVALFTIGAVLARAQNAASARGPSRLLGDVPLLVIYKLVAHPALVFGTGRLLQLAGAPRDGMVLVVVDLSAQRATVYRGGRPVAITTVSTGSTGRETPTGVFPILAKEKMHRSNLYNDAPMPFMQRLTWHGVALHAGQIPGYPASHGCVRLPKAFAEQLFGVTSRGNLVVVADDASADSLMRAGLQSWMAMQVGRLPGDADTMLASEGGVSGHAALSAP
jgi:predicted permease